jgi:hypothetical protein
VNRDQKEKKKGTRGAVLVMSGMTRWREEVGRRKWDKSRCIDENEDTVQACRGRVYIQMAKRPCDRLTKDMDDVSSLARQVVGRYGAQVRSKGDVAMR